jgi:nucleoside-diphosphate-sugar epimerase
MAKRIVFTGGSGKAGKYAIEYLLAQGHEVLNLDLKKLNNPKVHTLITDLTDSGQVLNGLTTHFGYGGYDNGAPPQPPDAVVHFAAIPAILMEPDNKTYHNNVMSTYNVLEVALKLGVRKIIIASSETTYGVCFAEGDKDYKKFPLEEDYEIDPMDSYGLSKLVNEQTARAFAARYKADIYALRIGNVIEPHEYDRFPGFVTNPETRKRNAWTYVDVRDLGQIVDLCVDKNGLGFQVFNAVNDTITSNMPTAEFLAKHCPNVSVTRKMEEFEGPLSNRKIKQVLGFKEQHNWRKYI